MTHRGKFHKGLEPFISKDHNELHTFRKPEGESRKTS